MARPNIFQAAIDILYNAKDNMKDSYYVDLCRIIMRLKKTFSKVKVSYNNLYHSYWKLHRKTIQIYKKQRSMIENLQEENQNFKEENKRLQALLKSNGYVFTSKKYQRCDMCQTVLSLNTNMKAHQATAKCTNNRFLEI